MYPFFSFHNISKVGTEYYNVLIHLCVYLPAPNCNVTVLLTSAAPPSLHPVFLPTFLYTYSTAHNSSSLHQTTKTYKWYLLPPGLY